MLPSILTNNHEKITQIAQDNDIEYLAVYGSYARGEQKPASDLDLLISFDKKKGLLGLIDVEQKLSKLLNVKVDLVTKKGLNKYIQPYIQDDIQVIYEKKS